MDRLEDPLTIAAISAAIALASTVIALTLRTSFERGLLFVAIGPALAAVGVASFALTLRRRRHQRGRP